MELLGVIFHKSTTRWSVSFASLLALVGTGCGNPLGTSESIPFNMTMGRAKPHVLISAPSINAINSSGAVTFTLTYLDFDVNLITASSILPTYTGSANNCVLTYTSLSPQSGQITFASCSGDGSVGFILSGGALLSQGTPSEGTISASALVDNTAPAVSLSSSTPAYFNSSTMNVSLTFSEPVFGLDAAALDVVNGNITGISGTGANYVVSISPAADSIVSVSVKGNSVNDSASNLNSGSTPLTRTSDTTHPTVVLASASTPDPFNTSTFTVTAQFSEAVSGFTTSGIQVTNGAASLLTNIGGNVYTFVVTPSADGLVKVSIGASAAYDYATNGNLASTVLNRTYDSTPPNPVLTTPLAISKVNSFTVNVTFNESVTGLQTSDFIISNGVATTLSGTGLSYALTVSPLSEGTVNVTLPSNVVIDGASNTNTVSNTLSLIYDATAPSAVTLPGALLQSAALYQSPAWSWSGGQDTVSGIKSFEYGVGTSGGDVSITGWKDLGASPANPFTAVNLPQLTAGNVYYVTVRVTDKAGNITPYSIARWQVVPISITPSNIVLASGNTVSLFVSGGSAPYSYSVLLGNGYFNNPTSSTFNAPGGVATQENTTIRVTDSDGNHAEAVITINPALMLTPSSLTATVGTPYTYYFSTLGGVAPITYSIISGGAYGSIDGGTGAYHPTGLGTVTVRATDALSNSQTASIQNIRIRTNGSVYATTTDANSLYVGGDFTAANPLSAPKIAALTLAGAPQIACNFMTGFNGDVNAIALSGSSLIVGGNFTTYQGQPARRLAKLDAKTCALDSTFATSIAGGGFNDTVFAIAVSSDSIYVGGKFTTFGTASVSANRLARLNLSDGSLNDFFSQTTSGATYGSTNGFDFDVYALAISGTSLYVGGAFSSYRGVAQSASSIAKLDVISGNIDTAFSPAGTNQNGFDGSVYTLAVDGTSLFVGGQFSGYHKLGALTPLLRIAKLNSTSGEVDTAFSSYSAANGFDGTIYSIAMDSTTLYVGGNFSLYRGSNSNNLIKLDRVTGAPDYTISAFNGQVKTLALSSSYLYVGGDFTSFLNVPHSANRLAKILLTNNSQDTTFLPSALTDNGFSKSVHILLATGNTLYVGGTFDAYSGQAAANIAKFNLTSWALDTNFHSSPKTAFDAPVRALALVGSSLFVGGDFTSYRDSPHMANKLAELNTTDGSINLTFGPQGISDNGFDSNVYAITSDGSNLYIGGNFTAYKGVVGSASHIAKILITTGTIDTTFSPVGGSANGVNGDVYALQLLGGSLYIGGNFSTYRGTIPVASIAKVSQFTGQLDSTFSPPANNGFNGAVYSLGTDGAYIFAGGLFTAYRSVANSALNFARLMVVDGALDSAAFNPAGSGFDGPVRAITVDGSYVYVGGSFSHYRGALSNSIARLELTSGTKDINYASTTGSPPPNGFNGSIFSLSTNGASLFVGGDFTSYLNTPAYSCVPLTIGAGVGSLQ